MKEYEHLHGKGTRRAQKLDEEKGLRDEEKAEIRRVLTKKC
jgi:hypothetical protein